MRYGFIGYTQVTDKDGKIVKEKVLKGKKPDPDIKLSKQIKSLMKTALFQTNESIWRVTKNRANLPGGLVKFPPAKPVGISTGPTLLASRLSDIFSTNNADYILKNWKKLDVEKFREIGHTARRYGAIWQPIYDLNSDEPTTHIELLQKLLQLLDYAVAKNFSTVFCFAFTNIKRYKELVTECPKLLRPYICLVPQTLKEHSLAMKWVSKRRFIRVALNSMLFSEVQPKLKKNEKIKLSKDLKLAYKEVAETWKHYYAGRFVPLCIVDMARISYLPMLARYCNVVVSDFDPIASKRGQGYKPR